MTSASVKLPGGYHDIGALVDHSPERSGSHPRSIAVLGHHCPMRGFTAMMVGVGNPVRKLDVLEGWVYQHGLRHLGEIEHARSLVGLGGLAG